MCLGGDFVIAGLEEVKGLNGIGFVVTAALGWYIDRNDIEILPLSGLIEPHYKYSNEKLCMHMCELSH